MGDILLRIAAIVLGLGLAVITLAVLGVSAIFIIEQIRRWRADRQGFGGFIDAGAPLEHDSLVDAFERPGVLEDGCVASVQPMGEIRIGDGTIIVQDPSQLLWDTEAPAPFDEAFPIGRFPVDALVLAANGDQRIAAVRIRFSHGTAASLEPAFTNEWRVALAKARRELPWFGIDSATAAIGTVSAFSKLAQRLADDPDDTEGLAPGRVDGSNPYLSADPTDLFAHTESEGEDLFVVLSGLGDGTGQCLIERDDARRVTALYADFGMLGTPRRLLNETRAAA